MGCSVHKCLTGIQISIHIFLNVSIVVSSIFPLRSLLPGHTDKRHSPSCYDGRWRLRHQPAQFGWSHREWKFSGNQKPSLFVDLFLAALPTWKPHIPHQSTCCQHHNTGLPWCLRNHLFVLFFIYIDIIWKELFSYLSTVDIKLQSTKRVGEKGPGEKKNISKITNLEVATVPRKASKVNNRLTRIWAANKLDGMLSKTKGLLHREPPTCHLANWRKEVWKNTQLC